MEVLEFPISSTKHETSRSHARVHVGHQARSMGCARGLQVECHSGLSMPEDTDQDGRAVRSNRGADGSAAAYDARNQYISAHFGR